MFYFRDIKKILLMLFLLTLTFSKHHINENFRLR